MNEVPGAARPAPPVAARRPEQTTVHGVTLTDDYAWLRDPGYPEVTDPEVLAYLEAENAYFEAVMAPRKALTETIFRELKGRLKEDDRSVPAKDGAFLYQWRFEAGAQYRQWFRKPVSAPEGDADWTLFLDEPALAGESEYFNLRDFEVSPDGRLLAYSTDGDGSERYHIAFADLAAGRPLDDAITNTSGTVVWAADNATLFYVELNENLRPFRVRPHRLGAPVEDDRIVYEEADPAFFVGIGKTHSRRFVVISAGDHVTSEARLIEAAEPEAAPRLVAPRVPGQEYDIEHRGERFYLRVNDSHRNFRVVTAPLDTPGRDHWDELIPGGERHYIQHVTCFKDFMVIEERVDGLDQVRLRDYGDGGDSPEEHSVAFPEASYAAGLGDTPEFDVATVRLGYTSMVTPATVYDYDVAARELTTLKVQEIPSGYDKPRYVTERLMAPTADGREVPISLVYRDDFPRGGKGDGTGPLHLYGYGAYGMGMSPAFSTARLSLLDRGFAYAIAHIRGGDELGYGWYEDGKLMKRENTFSDFEAAARHLIARGYAAPGRISIQGGSAGGTLVGVMANRHPELWRAVLAQVPFVDVLATMLDDSLPLTPIEWPEWGNPAADEAAFALIRGYCPYANVAAQAYPAMMITGGLTDPRVTYWEPAKWAAKLRALKTDENLLVLKTNMGAGHGGKSGRYEALHETAEEYTFLLMAFGKG